MEDFSERVLDSGLRRLRMRHLGAGQFLIESAMDLKGLSRGEAYFLALRATDLWVDWLEEIDGQKER